MAVDLIRNATAGHGSHSHLHPPLLPCITVSTSFADVAKTSQPHWRSSSWNSAAGLEKQSGRGHGLWGQQSQKYALRATFNSERGPAASTSNEGNDPPPPGCSRIKLELAKPLGLVLEEDKFGNIFVGEVLQDGNADKSGLVDSGDQLIATSAIVYEREEEYQGTMVRKGMQIVRLNVRGEKFETVMAAIGTHPAYIKVVLELQKCKPLQASTNGASRGGN